MTTYHYSRVSLEEQTIDNQHSVVALSGYKIDEWYSDSGVSGGTKACYRPQFSAMLEKLVSGDIIVVNSVDRIGRDTIDVLSTIDLLSARGVKVCVLAYGNLDLTSDMGRVVVTMAAAFAQLERSYLKSRTKAGMARTKEQGTKLGQPLKIPPAAMEEVAAGVPVADVSEKYNVKVGTLQKNVLKWGKDIAAYKVEWDKRKEQYEKKAA